MKKTIKKLAALLVAGVIAATAAIPSFAAPTAYTSGSIVVNNAVKGETYYAIKALDAVVSEDGIDYTGTIPTSLTGVLEVKTVGEAPYQYQAIGKKEGVTDEQYVAAMRAFADANKPFENGTECDGNSVTFSNLAPGFYVIVSTLNGADTNKVSAGSTFDPTATGAKNVGQVYEKNTTTVTVSKEPDGIYNIGDTITYTVKFNGANYRGEGDAAQIVTKYVVTDTLPEFLKDVTVTGISIGGTANEVNDTNFPNVTSFGTGKTFDIPWADGSHETGFTSKYANGTEVIITYTAVLTDIVKVGPTGNTNTVTIKPWTDQPGGPGPYDEEWNDSAKAYTYAAALKKTDGTKLLAGAKFRFNGLTVHKDTTATEAVYIVDSYNPTSTELGTEMEVGADGKLYILGLKQDAERTISLTGKETKAPDGYNILTSDVTLTPVQTSADIWATSGKRSYDAAGNLVASSTSTMYHHEGDVNANLETLDASAVEVVNKAGTNLPSTGGMGTTIFYVVGGILVLAAAVILISRRRVQR